MLLIHYRIGSDWFVVVGDAGTPERFESVIGAIGFLSVRYFAFADAEELCIMPESATGIRK